MKLEDIWKLSSDLLNGWSNGRLKRNIKKLAEVALDKSKENIELQEKIGQLQDEINRLKGEKAKPKIPKANSNKDLNPKPKKSHKKKNKKANLEIDEQVDCAVDKEELPSDAKRIGSREIVIQEIILKRRNIKFIIERFFSKELGKVIEGNVPESFKGSEFGPQLRSYVQYLYYQCRVPHEKIITTLKDVFGSDISKGTICTILNSPNQEFKDDLESARKGALKKDSKLYLDDTGARIDGVNANTYGVSNDYFTQYTTGFEKNRWSAVGALLGGVQSFFFDREAMTFIANKIRRPKLYNVVHKIRKKHLSRDDLEERLKEVDFNVSKDELDTVRTAGALGALRNCQNGPPIRFLVSDDGTNFNDLHRNHQLCWVHEYRKFKKLKLSHPVEIQSMEELLDDLKDYYRFMKNYKNSPSKEGREFIRKRFDEIVNQRTMFKDIDDQLGRMKKNKKRLLLFLTYPQLPLHSNMIERDLRERVIKRKISLQNRSMSGVRAWDLMMSLASTCRKLGLSFWRYLEDRNSKREEIPYLGRLVNQM